MMNALAAFASLVIPCAVFASNAHAASVTIRVPVLFEDPATDRIYNASELQTEFTAAGLSVPEFIEIESASDAEQLGAIQRLVENADIKAPGSTMTLEGVRYGRISSFQGPDVKKPMCYRALRNASVKQVSREAMKLVAQLPDSVLSDQYVIVATRFYDEKDFKGEDLDEEYTKHLVDTYGSTKLKAGDIQIIATTNDDGDNDAEDLLPLCAQ
jgi:hypothetical protein